MKLGKLLFAGKSVVSGSERVSYRQNKLVALPKFESSKNPFAPAKTPPETNPTPDKKESGQASDAGRKREPVSKASKSLASWTTRLNPASLWGGVAPAVR